MSREAKKALEREIFDSVYESLRLSEVTPSERPDFLVKAKGGTGLFGVEVTELFLSETNARLERIPGYVTDLLSRRSFKHKADSKALKVGDFDLISPKGEKKGKVAGIMQPMAPIESVAEQTAEAISRKSAAFAKADNVSHVNLIIADRSRRFSRTDSSDFYTVLFTRPVQEAVARSPFREIVFLTRMKQGDGYFPLKLLQLVSECSVFVEGSKASGLSHLLPEKRPFIEVFAAYFFKAVSQHVLYWATEDEGEVIYGDTGFTLTEKMEPIVRMHMDLPLPAPCRVPAVDLCAIFDDAFIEKINAYRASNTFKSSLWFKSHKAAPQSQDGR